MSGLFVTISCSVLISAICNIRAEYVGSRRQVYICKPLTTSLIIALAIISVPATASQYGILVVLALLFCLAGDIFLMLPQDRFIPGLVSFLIAHLLYIGAFVSRAGFHLTPIVFAPFLIFAGSMLIILWPHLAQMKVPVTIYLIVILMMGWQAAEQWNYLQSRSAAIAALGAISFMISDSLLALDRFRAPFFSARGMVLGSYFLAQWLIALSVSA